MDRVNNKHPGIGYIPVIFVLCLTTLMSSIDTSIVDIGLRTIEEALNANFSSVQWVILSYMLAVTSLIVGIGRIGDIFGKKKLFIFGIALFTVASFLCGVSVSIYELIVFRAFQGIGAATLIALSFAIVGDLVPKEKVVDGMAKRLGDAKTMIFGILILGIGIFIMSAFGILTSMITIAITVFLWNGGLAFFQAPNNAFIMSLAKPEQRGLISGLLNLARTIGQTTGIAALGALFYVFIRTKSIVTASPKSIVSGIHSMFLVTVLIVTCAFLLGMAVYKPWKKERTLKLMLHKKTSNIQPYRQSLTIYMAVRLPIMFTTQMVSVAVGWQIYVLTKSAFYLGLVGLVQFVPMVLLTLIVRMIADRFNRKAIICLSEAAQTVVFVFLAIGNFILSETILIVVFLLGVFNAFQGPALQSLLPNIVPNEDFTRAAAGSTSASQVAIISLILSRRPLTQCEAYIVRGCIMLWYCHNYFCCFEVVSAFISDSHITWLF